MPKPTIPAVLKITAIDPNEYLTITKESFISKYGKAAKQLCEEIEVKALSSQLQDIIREVEGMETYKTRLFIQDNEARLTKDNIEMLLKKDVLTLLQQKGKE